MANGSVKRYPVFGPPCCGYTGDTFAKLENPGLGQSEPFAAIPAFAAIYSFPDWANFFSIWPWVCFMFPFHPQNTTFLPGPSRVRLAKVAHALRGLGEGQPSGASEAWSELEAVVMLVFWGSGGGFPPRFRVCFGPRRGEKTKHLGAFLRRIHCCTTLWFIKQSFVGRIGLHPWRVLGFIHPNTEPMVNANQGTQSDAQIKWMPEVVQVDLPQSHEKWLVHGDLPAEFPLFRRRSKDRTFFQSRGARSTLQRWGLILHSPRGE